MHHPAAMGVVDGLDGLAQQGHRPPRLKPDPGHGAAADELHGQVVTAAVLADLVDGDDARVVEARRHPRLPQEPGVDGPPFVHELDGDEALLGELPRPMHHTEAARSDALEQHVVPEPDGTALARLGLRHDGSSPGWHCPPIIRGLAYNVYVVTAGDRRGSQSTGDCTTVARARERVARGGRGRGGPWGEIIAESRAARDLSRGTPQRPMR